MHTVKGQLKAALNTSWKLIRYLGLYGMMIINACPVSAVWVPEIIAPPLVPRSKILELPLPASTNNDKLIILQLTILHTSSSATADVVTAACLCRNEVDDHVWRFLLTGGVALENPHPNPASEWMTDRSWSEIVRASELPSLNNFMSRQFTSASQVSSTLASTFCRR